MTRCWLKAYALLPPASAYLAHDYRSMEKSRLPDESLETLVQAMGVLSIKVGHEDEHEDVRDACCALRAEAGGPVTQASQDARRKRMGIEDDVNARHALGRDLLGHTLEGRKCQTRSENSEGEEEHHEGLAGSPVKAPFQQVAKPSWDG